MADPSSGEATDMSKLSKNKRRKLKRHKIAMTENEKSVSMIELKQKAQAKIELIQKENRDKSVAKINELRQQHLKGNLKKRSKSQQGKEERKEVNGDDEKKDQRKFNKGKVNAGKHANKRKQKEADKKKKMNKEKGIIQKQEGSKDD